jgi:hypothetical protein
MILFGHQKVLIFLKKGSKTENFNENLIFQLKNSESEGEIKLLYLNFLKFKSFMASWQDNNIYNPNNIKISIGFDDKNFDIYESNIFSVEKTNLDLYFNLNVLILFKHDYKKTNNTEKINQIINEKQFYNILSRNKVNYIYMVSYIKLTKKII